MNEKIRDYVRLNARHHLERHRTLARRGRKAYRTEPMKSATATIAAAHERCAAIWQDLIDRADSPTDVGECPRCTTRLRAITSACGCVDGACDKCNDDWCVYECDEHSYRNIDKQPK